MAEHIELAQILYPMTPIIIGVLGFFIKREIDRIDKSVLALRPQIDTLEEKGNDRYLQIRERFHELGNHMNSVKLELLTEVQEMEKNANLQIDKRHQENRVVFAEIKTDLLKANEAKVIRLEESLKNTNIKLKNITAQFNSQQNEISEIRKMVNESRS